MIDDELILAQNPATATNATMQEPGLSRSLTAPGLSMNLLSQRRRPLGANDELLDSDNESEGSPRAPQSTTQPFLRRSATNNSGVIESSNSTVSFRNTANVATSNQVSAANSINPFAASVRRSNQTTGFFASVGGPRAQAM